MAIFTVHFSTSVRMSNFLFLGLYWGFEFFSGTRNIFMYFIFCLPRGVPSEQELDAAQYSLASIRNDMRSRKEEAARREGSTVCVLSLSQYNLRILRKDHLDRNDFMVLPSRVLISG